MRLFRWSSENHHLARAHAAVALLHDLIEQKLTADQRILLWGHSHAGNVFALVTNLLASKRPARKRFFRACRSYFRHRNSQCVDLAVWQRVQSWLETADVHHDLPHLDFVTFGTPIRYGWDSAGYSRLLHIVHHHPREKLPPYLTQLPGTFEDVGRAVGGDYVQHWGIAGTNLAPGLFPFGTWLADFRLGRFLQRKLAPRWLLRRLRLCQRVPSEGITLLIDYEDGEGLSSSMAGHAVYTRIGWLPFHARLVAETLYGPM